MSLIGNQLPMFIKEPIPVEMEGVRALWLDGEWRFSVVDVVRALTESAEPRKYWSKLKTKLGRETDVSTICRHVEMPDTLGRMQEADVATYEQLFRIIQAMPSNKITGDKVERVKLWLARKGAQSLDDEADPERVIARYRGKISRKAFMDAIRDALSPPQWVYAQATNDVYLGVFQRDAEALKRVLHTRNIRDKMDTIGLSYLSIAETICARHIGKAEELSVDQARVIWNKIAKLIGRQVDTIEQQTGFDAVTGQKILGPGDAIRGA